MSHAPDLTLELPPFSFQPLESASSIRVLEVLPGNPNQHIACTLHHTTIDANDYAYNALSYTWGDATKTRVIECNGARAVISQNLHSALSRLRDRRAPLLLWVDAICIDQRLEPMSLREREKQVRMMDKIYSQAQKVYVGLGDAGGEMERLIPFLSTFDAIPNDFYSEPNTIMGILAEFDLPKVEDPAWAEYAQFMTRPWFSRVWIMLEFILAREVVVFAGMQNFGYEFLDWLVFAGFQYRKVMEAYIQAWLMRGENRGELIKSLLPAIREGHGNLFRIMQTRRERLEGESDYRDFCNYLSSSKSFGATDNRDRAYALLGLATDVDPSTFPVSYSESTEEVSMRVARYLIQNGDGGLCIIYMRRDQRPVPILGL
jgi:hypothetical protein